MMIGTKPKSIAILLVVVLGLISIASGARILSFGSAGAPPMPGAEQAGGPPFGAGLMFVALGVAMLFGAFGWWKSQKWGRVVAIITCAINGFFTLGDLMGTIMLQHYAFAALFAVMILACLAVIVLALRREPAPGAANTAPTA